jgi:ABC-type multidrug transport system fused ATPase/permease subunit
MVRPQLIRGAIASILHGFINTGARPVCLYLAVEAVSAGAQVKALWLVFLVTASVLLEGIVHVYVRHTLSDDCMTTYVSAAIMLMQHKAIMRGPSSELQQENSIVGNDIIRTFENGKMCYWGLMSPGNIFIGIITLYWAIGSSCLVGVAVMFFILLVTLKLSEWAKRAEAANLAAADRRMSIMEVMIKGIKAVKMMAWEPNYLSLLDEVRAKECKYIKDFRLPYQQSINLGKASPVLGACASFLFMALRGERLEASRVFAALAVFQSLRLPLIAVGMCLSTGKAILVSAGRIDSYLLLPDSAGSTPYRVGTPHMVGAAGVHMEVDEEIEEEVEAAGEVEEVEAVEVEEEEAVRLEGACFEWPRTHPLELIASASQTHDREDEGTGTLIPFKLQSIDLSVLQGTMTALVGACGSGKSSLLSALLGDLHMSAGVLRLRKDAWDRLGLVTQRPFVLSGTLKENIVMGRPFDEERYEETVRAAQLQVDLRCSTGEQSGDQEGAGERVSLRDGTQLGERGVTLSGGQQQRLGIARALYGEPDMLLVDDALSAVDAQVAKAIFEHFCAFVAPSEGTAAAAGTAGTADRRPVSNKKKTVLMALNQLHLLPHFDQVVYLKNGRIEACGSHDKLLQTNAEYAQFVNSKPLTSPTSTDAQPTEGPTPALAPTTPVPTSQEASAGSDPASASTNAPASTTSSPSSFIAEEHKESGAMKSSVSIQFVQAMGVLYFATCMLLCGVAHGLIGLSDRWLALWVESQAVDSYADRNSYFAAVYATINGAHLAMLGVSSYCICEGVCRAGKRLHHDTLSHLLRTPVAWYEATPSGRITSRFSMDLSQVDLMLGFMVDNMSSFIFSLLVLVGVVVYLVPPLAAAAVLGLVIYGVLVLAADSTNREVKRMANNAMSPVLSTMSEAAEGRLLLRQMGFTDVRGVRFAISVVLTVLTVI